MTSTAKPFNNFNQLRFLAALAVLWSHCYPLTYGAKFSDPLRELMGFTVGHLSVDIFFFISGYLITLSLIRSTSKRQFVLNRLLRIYPGVVIAVVLSTILYAIVVSNLDLKTWLIESSHYILVNGSLAKDQIDYSLPGLFVSNPYKDIVNGSLWTLPWELRMYLLLGFLGFSFPSKRRLILPTVTLLALFIHIWRVQVVGAETAFSLVDLLARFITFFFMGSSLQILVPNWKPKVYWGALGLLVWLLVNLLISKEIAYPIYVVSLPIIILGLAFYKNWPELTWNQRSIDLSYGTYLYAFPIQQLIISTGQIQDAMTLFMIAAPITILFATLSWFLIEKPCLQLKHKFQFG